MLVKEDNRLELYFGSTLSAVNTLLIAGVSFFIAFQYNRRKSTSGWGESLLVLVSAGLLICILAAIRDNYALSVTAAASGGETGLFSIQSIQSILASVAGAGIAIVAGSTIFIRNDKFRRIAFFIVSGLFVIKLLLIEASRIMLGVG
jgi:hypothetical protein